MPTQADRMNPTASGADHKLAAGIYSIEQAAAMLDCEPIAVKRLIALGRLNDNRNRSGSVVLKNELEAYIGQGSPDIEMPEVEGDWFKWFRGELSRTEFQSLIRKASDGLPEISDKQLKNAFEADRRATTFRFDVRPTPAMREAYRRPTTVEIYRSQKLEVPRGVAVLVCVMRDYAKHRLNRVDPMGPDKLLPPLWRLFDSPKRFKDMRATAEVNAIKELTVEFRESRVIEGRSNPANVIRAVAFQDLSTNWGSDLRQAVSLAF